MENELSIVVASLVDIDILDCSFSSFKSLQLSSIFTIGTSNDRSDISTTRNIRPSNGITTFIFECRKVRVKAACHSKKDAKTRLRPLAKQEIPLNQPAILHGKKKLLPETCVCDKRDATPSTRQKLTDMTHASTSLSTHLSAHDKTFYLTKAWLSAPFPTTYTCFIRSFTSA